MDNKGFTLVELLIVIAIIAILSSIAFPFYLKYQRKAKVTSYAQPIARNCLIELVSFCSENASSYSTKTFSDFTGCRVSVPTPGGNALLDIANSSIGNCSSTGRLTGAKVIYSLTGVLDFQVKCETDAEGNVFCKVVTVQ